MVVVKYVYDGWGNHGIEVVDPACETLANLNPFRYRSYYFDTETELYFLKTRYYDPEIGRFMTIDDISYLDPETINGLNLYAYCGNNPVMNVDPNGNAWWEWLLGALLVVGITVASVFTAGAAAWAVGLSVTTIKAVMVGAAVGGLIAGGSELIRQGVSTDWQTVNLGALAVETFAGAAYGAIAGVSATTNSVGLYYGMKAARVALSGVQAYSYNRAIGNSRSDSLAEARRAALLSLAIQAIASYGDFNNGYTSNAGLTEGTLAGLRGAFDLKGLIVTGGIVSGKSVWKYFSEQIGGIAGLNPFLQRLFDFIIWKAIA